MDFDILFCVLRHKEHPGGEKREMRKKVLLVGLVALLSLIPMIYAPPPTQDDPRMIPDPILEPEQPKYRVRVFYHFDSLVGQWFQKPNQTFVISGPVVVVIGNSYKHIERGLTLVAYIGPDIEPIILDLR